MKDNRPRYRSLISDSARWNGFPFRAGDIVICTPSKCGTTWMQMICALLIFQDPGLDRPLSTFSPWLDMLTRTKAEVFALLEAQPNRRFIKTHTPLDGLPMEDQVTYICVGRDPRDAAISFLNHRTNLDIEAMLSIVQEVARLDGLGELKPPGALPPAESLETDFWRWIDDPAPVTSSGVTLYYTLHHFEQALHARARANVVVLHYNDLKADIEGEMRCLAARLGIEVLEQTWPRLVKAASFESMRARAEDLAPDSRQNIWKDPQKFFHSGTGGHWREFFDDAAQRRYEARVQSLVPAEVAAWAHGGGRESRGWK